MHVTDEAVDVALPRRLVDDVLMVVVAQAAAQLLIVHLGLVLTLAPSLSHLTTHNEHVMLWNSPNLGSVG